MKDIPVFTSQYGLATLLLREIPLRGCAYVLVRSVWDGRLPALLDECRRFCRMAGAETVLATADVPLPLPHAYDLLELACRRDALPPLEAPVALRPVTAANAAAYLRLYHRLFRPVRGAALYTAAELDRVLTRESAYLALADGAPAGLGQHTASELRAVGVLPAHRGLGRRLTLTLLGRMTAETVTLQVTSVNAPALRLYEGLGFAPAQTVSRWYDLTAE